MEPAGLANEPGLVLLDVVTKPEVTFAVTPVCIPSSSRLVGGATISRLSVVVGGKGVCDCVSCPCMTIAGFVSALCVLERGGRGWEKAPKVPAFSSTFSSASAVIDWIPRGLARVGLTRLISCVAAAASVTYATPAPTPNAVCDRGTLFSSERNLGLGWKGLNRFVSG